MNNNVYITKIDNDTLDKHMESLLASLGICRIGNNQKICIKINLCDYRLSTSGATTDPLILGSLLKGLRNCLPNSEIFAIESDASGTNVDILFELLGINNICEMYSCEAINISKGNWITKKIEGRYFDDIEIPSIVNDCDIFINHPKLKTHMLTKVSICLKNTFGCIKAKNKVKYHGKLDDVIVDINKAIKSDYCIVDGNLCLEGIGGPCYGTPKDCGLLIGGRNAVNVDAFCAKLMGFNPRLISHIYKSKKSGLGDTNYEIHPMNFDLNYKDYKFNFDILQYYLLRLFRSELNL